MFAPVLLALSLSKGATAGSRREQANVIRQQAEDSAQIGTSHGQQAQPNDSIKPRLEHLKIEYYLIFSAKFGGSGNETNIEHRIPARRDFA